MTDFKRGERLVVTTNDYYNVSKGESVDFIGWPDPDRLPYHIKVRLATGQEVLLYDDDVRRPGPAVAISGDESQVFDAEQVQDRINESIRRLEVAEKYGAYQTGEVRVTSETGGQKGRKTEELGSVDPLALKTLGEVSGFGAQKYEAFNYLRGYNWDLSINALLRHVLSGWNGEDYDPESGLPHFTHAAWHALALTSFLLRGLGTDTRFKQEVTND